MFINKVKKNVGSLAMHTGIKTSLFIIHVFLAFFARNGENKCIIGRTCLCPSAFSPSKLLNRLQLNRVLGILHQTSLAALSRYVSVISPAQLLLCTELKSNFPNVLTEQKIGT
jgi:hypothetical protein